MVVVLVVALVLGAGGVAALPARAADDPGVQPQVVGGTMVPDGKYPFVAALLDTRFGSTPTKQQFCTGTFIDQNSVLTAAHCVVGTSPQPLRVLVGRTVLSKSDQGQERSVSAIFIHPSYNGKRSDAYDAAVLELNDSVSAIAPLKLATSSQNSLEKPGHRVKIAGWGETGSGYPDRMQEASVPVVSDTYARKVYGRFFVRALMVAAGETGVDTCVGDSGGPAFAQTSGGPRQIGITSFGAARCGARGQPGVYTEVNASSIRNFITSAAKRRSGALP
jgi:secreted trypsin-like serine protease